MKADSMRHSFEDESALDIREYISVKQGLYVEAGETDEDLVVRRPQGGLDPTLAAVVILRPMHNAMSDFLNKIYAAEHQARAHYF
jgi:hypothetical protein